MAKQHEQERTPSSDFTRDDRVQELIDELKANWNGKEVSDIIDDAGHQYVDLVMEGGGVLGIALLGYTYALEEVGVRFLSIAGTSAGSIGALLLAAVDTKEHPKSVRIAEALANQDLGAFIDGPRWARRFITAALNKGGRARLLTSYLLARGGFLKHLGFNPGDAFLEWLQGVLRKSGIATTQDLETRLAHVPQGLRRLDEQPLVKPEERASVAIITAEVSTETKVEFPEMAPLFWEDPRGVDPACYVRASMSVPYFFHPYRVKSLPQGARAVENWERLASYDNAPPTEAIFLDGGIMSNFPIDVFHRTDAEPAAPTLGVKLGTDDRKPQHIKRPASLGLAAFNAARHSLDYDFIKRNPDYKHLVAYVDTGDHNWLDFNLTREAQIDLFRRGVETAVRFLLGAHDVSGQAGDGSPAASKGFDWTRYKGIREGMIPAYELAGPLAGKKDVARGGAPEMA